MSAAQRTVSGRDGEMEEPFKEEIMTKKNGIYKEARQSIIEFNANRAQDVVQQGLDEGIDPMKLLEEAFIPAINEVGDLFGNGRMFIPELVQAADAMQKVTDVINAAMEKSNVERKSAKVLIGTVEGDVHDIGKTIIVSLFKANGFDVLDIGRDVSVERLIEEAEKFGADVIGTSALLTTTMRHQKELEQQLKKAGLREKYKTIVGGAPVTQRWADRIGSDAYAHNAQDGVKKVNQLLGLN
jgi:trimethylamine corrinoid protein